MVSNLSSAVLEPEAVAVHQLGAGLRERHQIILQNVDASSLARNEKRGLYLSNGGGGPRALAARSPSAKACRAAMW